MLSKITIFQIQPKAFPVLLFYLPIKWIKQDKKKQKKNHECLNILNSVEYNPHVIQGDEHTCTICRMDYIMQDRIKILPCSPLHHFHSGCIKAWFNISPTCPLCRKELGQIIDDIRSSNGAPSYLILDQFNSQVNNQSIVYSNNQNQSSNQPNQQ